MQRVGRSRGGCARRSACGCEGHPPDYLPARGRPPRYGIQGHGPSDERGRDGCEARPRGGRDGKGGPRRGGGGKGRGGGERSRGRKGRKEEENGNHNMSCSLEPVPGAGREGDGAGKGGEAPREPRGCGRDGTGEGGVSKHNHSRAGQGSAPRGARRSRTWMAGDRDGARPHGSNGCRRWCRS